MKMACRFYHWCHYFSQRISCLWNTLRFITFFFFFFSFYREATMKSVKSNSFISLAGLIMEFLTMQQACFHLYEESNYLILLVQDLLSSTAGVCRCGRFFPQLHMWAFITVSCEAFIILKCFGFCFSPFELPDSHCSRIWLSTATFENS